MAQGGGGESNAGEEYFGQEDPSDGKSSSPCWNGAGNTGEKSDIRNHRRGGGREESGHSGTAQS